MRYRLPVGMRYSTLFERREFYRKEFSLDQVSAWFEGIPHLVHPQFAVIIGRHTGIFPGRYREDRSTTIIISNYHDLLDLRRQILEFVPESVYYDRNVYHENRRIGQELAFDVDPENLVCPVHGTFADRMKNHQGLAFCEIELEMVKEETINMHEMLEESFSTMRVVYSGRGFHIHVLDEEVFSWTPERRRSLALDLKKKGFPFDEWVTSGSMRLIRLPYSLHGMVSRKVVPLEISELKKFDPLTDPRCLPHFLGRDPT